MKTSTDGLWKERLYGNYVSSGQASTVIAGGPEQAFRSRAAYINSVIKRHVPNDKGLQIVDIGCGHGTFIYFLRLAGYSNVMGIDASAEQVAVALQFGIPGIHHRQLREYMSSAEQGSVDVVLLIDLLEHLTKDELLETLDGVHRILRPGGTCIAHVPNAEGVFGMSIRYGDLTHEQAFTRRSIEQAFRTTGFHSVLSFEERPIVHGLKSFARWSIWMIGTIPQRLLYAAEVGVFTTVLSQNILVRCTK